MLEQYFDRRESLVIPELVFEVVEGKQALDNALISRKTWLAKHVGNAIKENPSLIYDVVGSFPEVSESHTRSFLEKLKDKDIKVRNYVPDFSVSNNRLKGAEKRWLQQKFTSTELGTPLARLVPNVEDVVENYEDIKEKGRLILSPAGIMVYEFTSYTEDIKYSGVFTHTCFISVHEVYRTNGIKTLGTFLRGEIQRHYDEESQIKLHDHRREMAKRRRIALGTSSS